MDYKKGVIIKKSVSSDEVEFLESFLLTKKDILDLIIYNFVGIRDSENFAFKAIYLSNQFDWQIVKDNEGFLIAVPTNKKDYREEQI